MPLIWETGLIWCSVACLIVRVGRTGLDRFKDGVCFLEVKVPQSDNITLSLNHASVYLLSSARLHFPLDFCAVLKRIQELTTAESNR